MEFKQVKEVSPIEEKSTQEVEQNLLDKHEESLKVSDVNENVSETSNVVEETTVEENKAEQDVADLPEIKDEDVLSYIKERYNKDISSVDELFSEQEKNSPLPDEVSKYLDFKKETGRGFEDFIKANRSYDNLEDDQILKEYYSLTESDLDSEDIEYLMEDKFGYDEEVDDDRDIKKKNISKKRELAIAKKYLSKLSETYKTPLESSGGSYSEEQLNEINAYKEYVQKAQTEVESNKRKSEYFQKKTDEVFNSEFKGFEFKVGDKNVIYSSGDANEIKSKQVNVQSFINQYIGEDGLVNDAQGWHKALNAAMNPDKLAQYFYEQGKADAIGDVSKKSKNINMSLRQTPQSSPQKGFQARAVSTDSGRGLRIRSKNKNN
tara:strand:- start:347 stop:1480 length:1134 start_codon:yes stop_codon:yes gene_type:complete